MWFMTRCEGKGLRDTSKGKVTLPKKALVLQFNADMESFVFTISCILATYIYSNSNKGCLYIVLPNPDKVGFFPF